MLITATALPLLGFLSLMSGPLPIQTDAIWTTIRSLLNPGIAAHLSPLERTVIIDIRLPRIVLALLVGGGLAMAGATMQSLFRNPLADPGIVGVSMGAVIGAVGAIVLVPRLMLGLVPDAMLPYAVPLCAMTGALVATLLIYKLARVGGQVDLVSMILVGIALNAIGGSFVGLMTFLATDDELRTLTFWGLGSLGRAGWDLILPALPFLLIPMILLPFYAIKLNALILGEEGATALGIDLAKTKRSLVILVAALVGAATSLCGTIGFVALVVPHICRTLIGADLRWLMPICTLAGGALLLVADWVARTIVAPAELPIGILTSLLGGPIFLALLIRRKQAMEGRS